jgi:RNA polymerase sigma-70 factor (ECF subfamily)
VESNLPTEIAALYDRYAPDLYRYIYHRLGAKTLAEDLTAEVFVRVLRLKRAPDDWRAYLYRIAHNLVIDYTRRNPGVWTDAREGIAEERADLFERASVEDERRTLRRAIARLSPDQQQVILLKFVEEFSNAEIARIMGKSEGAVKALQHRALGNLREWLREPSEARLFKQWNESTRIA